MLNAIRYVSTKGAIASLTRAMAIEEAENGVKLFTTPYYIYTVIRVDLQAAVWSI